MADEWTASSKENENRKNRNEFPRNRGKWQELSEDLIYDNPWIRVSESQVVNPNGGRGIYGVVHFKNLAIGIIPLDEDWNTWIVGQERFPFGGKYTWEIIEGGGPLERDPLESAKMELAEEAGLGARKWDLIQELDLSNSATTERSLLYVARDLYPAKAEADHTELLELKKVPFNELYRMVCDGEIVDSLSVTATLKLKLLLDEQKI